MALAQTLTFHSWVRESVSATATGQSGGRAAAAAAITLTASAAHGSVSGVQSRTVPFLLAGPADVIGLTPAAIVRRFPTAGAVDHESDRCPYIELADASLPWRYTPTADPVIGSAELHPWLVLVVGEEASELTFVDGRVTIAVNAQLEHTLGAPATRHRYAHVQVDGAGHRTARVLSGRRLNPGTDYVAVVVPAYDETGAVSWTGIEPVTVPVYDVWRFRTAVPAGSFEDLAERLRPGDAPASTGRAPVRYPRLDGAPQLEVLGAFVAVPATGEVAEDPLPPAIGADLAGLRLPARDPQGRPIVTVPRYGEAWDPAAPDDATWGRALNRDPRRRGVAGLGLEVGIRFQEDLVADVIAHLGALQEARQRVRDVVMGLAATRSLWQRRIPAEPEARLWLLGPSLSRLVAGNAIVADQVTADDRTPSRGSFSAAAQRVLRAGPARTRRAAAAPVAVAVLDAVNAPPPSAPTSLGGLALDRDARVAFEAARRRVVNAGRVPTAALAAAANSLATRTDPRMSQVGDRVVQTMIDASRAGRAVPWAQALTTLAASDAAVVAAGRDPSATARKLAADLTDLRDRFGERADDSDLVDLVADLDPLTSNDLSLAPVDIVSLATGVAAAFDPTSERPPVVDRVLATISGGIDPVQPLAPPEPCIGLERAAWSDVERAFAEWLLPGVAQIPDNSVISLETNPVFVDSFLAGLNTGVIAELRWRNIPVATGCTPIRRFWDRADTASGDRVDDIVGIQSWAASTSLGDASHIASGSSGRDLVIAVRGELFLRYPTTLVYLASAGQGSPPVTDFDEDPDDDAARVFPGFQGRLATDVAFFGFPGFDATELAHHWVVFEEPPAGYRFANDATTTATTGHEWAVAALAEPVRVLIRGDSLTAGGG